MEFKSEVFDRFSALFKKRKGNKLKKAELLKEQVSVKAKSDKVHSAVHIVRY